MGEDTVGALEPSVSDAALLKKREKGQLERGSQIASFPKRALFKLGGTRETGGEDARRGGKFRS